jgi:hypothetical protein
MDMLRQMTGDQAVIEVTAKDTIRISSRDAQELLVRTIEALARTGTQLENVSISPPTLEEVFLTVVNGTKSSF